MTIGELLKEYRLKKGLTQKQFADGIVSTSYYSKVEKDGHRITAEDLIAVLEHNGIPLWSFFKNLTLKGDFEHYRNLSIEEEALDAYYRSDKKQLEVLKKEIDKSHLPNKNELYLSISGWIECMKTNDDEPDIQVREDLKNQIFNMPSINLNKLTLFCNFMEFYDLDSNFFITKQAINKFIDTKEVDIQEVLLSIIGNLLYLSIKEGNYNYTDYLLQNSKKISIKPRLFLEKELIAFYQNLIDYHFNKKQVYIENCKDITHSIKLAGIDEYSYALNGVINKYTS